jgi:hypothetical protein
MMHKFEVTVNGKPITGSKRTMVYDVLQAPEKPIVKDNKPTNKKEQKS